MRTWISWSVIAAAAVIVGGGWWLQRAKGDQLKAELAAKQERRAEWERVSALNRQLRETQIPAEELERLRADRQAVSRLRDELAALEGAAKKPTPTPAPKAAEAQAAGGRTRTIPSVEWKNAGRESPAAAVETALWAAAGGDVDALAATLFLGEAARRRAETVLAGLSPEARQQYPTPEKFAALFTARDLPSVGELVLFQAAPRSETEIIQTAAVRGGESGRLKNVELTSRRFDDGWKLEVPESAIDKYAAALKAPNAIMMSPVRAEK